MVAWSVFTRNISQKALSGAFTANKNLLSKPVRDVCVKQVRKSGDHGPQSMVIKASDWQWDKFKDLVHFYIMVGALPITVLLTYVNVFIGPAQLAPIPEGYEPKHWEYHKHPITRFLARYIVRNPQQEYEKMCHELYQESEKILLRRLERNVKEKMAEKQDYQAWYYRPAMVKYARHSKQFFEDEQIRSGSG